MKADTFDDGARPRHFNVWPDLTDGDAPSRIVFESSAVRDSIRRAVLVIDRHWRPEFSQRLVFVTVDKRGEPHVEVMSYEDAQQVVPQLVHHPGPLPPPPFGVVVWWPRHGGAWQAGHLEPYHVKRGPIEPF